MDKTELNSLKIKAKDLQALVRIGKNGLTEGIIHEVDKNIKKYKLIKVKLLKALVDTVDRKEFAKELAEKTGSTLVQIVGSVAILYRKSSKEFNKRQKINKLNSADEVNVEL